MSQQVLEVMAKSMDQLKCMFKLEMDQLKERIDKTSSPPSATVSSLAVDLASFRTFVMGALQLLQDQLQVISSEVDGMEMRSRHKILLLHGVPEIAKEDTAEVIVKTVVQKLKLNDFARAAISRCHRMGRSATGDKPRPIFIKLQDIALRNKIWFAKTSLKNTGITMSDPGMTSLWLLGSFLVCPSTRTQDGCVFVIGENGTRRRVNCQQELEKVRSQGVPRPAAVIKVPAAGSSVTRRAAKK
ncbi:Uncharacterized protein OBRU01_04691 [Operophtera brumata]|uniref:Uncharacterized protein n=1 Tax=Operophtera brumata TaxID=104452 RepID=A0A0L7LN09_OPEBR|nr:Uncharacterized protein OBRU01_04691 [Operophtera brumata]